MNLDKWLYNTDDFLQRYFLPIILTLFVHLIIIGILILLEISKPDYYQNNDMVLTLQNEEPEGVAQSQFVPTGQNTPQGEEDVKNVEKNLSEGNKSFQDYYREAKSLLNHGASKEVFQANDYKDQRVLIKDYSNETPDVQNWNKPQPLNENNNITPHESKSTYAGSAIISYDAGGRKAVRLPIPAYKCQGYGKVTIEIEINQRGVVTAARITETEASLNESCLPNSAQEAALNSRFVVNDKAPTSQKGFIYYTFIAQ